MQTTVWGWSEGRGGEDREQVGKGWGMGTSVMLSAIKIKNKKRNTTFLETNNKRKEKWKVVVM